MTSEDDSSLDEDEIDEIVDRVVDRLQAAGLGEGGDGEDGEEDRAGSENGDGTGDRGAGAAGTADDERTDRDVEGERIPVRTGDDERDGADDPDDPRGRRERARRERERVREARERAERKKERAKRETERAKGRGPSPGGPTPPDPPHGPDPDDWEAFGDRMEEFGHRMEEFGERLGRRIEQSLAGADLEPGDAGGVAGLAGLNVTPEEHTRTAIYKSQLQKGGRIAVPDAEIEALGIAPGDTLQVVLFPVGRSDEDGGSDDGTG